MKLNRRRLQIELNDSDSQVLDELKVNTQSTITEVIRNSLVLYNWAITESQNHRYIVSVENIPENQSVTKPMLKGINRIWRQDET